MPRFDLALSQQAALALKIVQAGEFMRISGWTTGKTLWTQYRIEALYELAFLRIFSCWEAIIEDVFYRSLCGYGFSSWMEQVMPSKRPSGRLYYPTIAAAEAAVLNGGDFLLWHDTHKVLSRYRQWLQPHAVSNHGQANVISSQQSMLQFFSRIRHRIAHSQQKDARRKFDAATTQFASRIYPASRPGSLLRDHVFGISPPQTWLTHSVNTLVSLSQQLV
jgi:hypothetical protein